ncbi:LdpA C-terminal domain-containing domain [Kamptonema cortianum]|nr:LdpA C-terminal domain-containing domain [Kamptonema cortianum]
MSDLNHPLHSLRNGRWFKLICGASYQHLPAVRNLTLAYTLAGADCIDVAADEAVVAAAQEAIAVAQTLKAEAQQRGFWHQANQPLLMASLNDAEDPHFRKADFNPTQCPPACSQPCQNVCPAEAIAFNRNFSGIIDQRCYGCGRCLPICPSALIIARAYVITPQILIKSLPWGTPGIGAVEIHTQIGHLADFQRLWQSLQPILPQLELLAISCPDGEGLIDYLQTLSTLIHPLPCPLLWQTDGRPMSGDIGAGTTHASIKLAQKVLAAQLPGFVQLAGGTNRYTVPKLKAAQLLKDPFQPGVAGVAYGSYARVLLSSIIDRLEAQSCTLAGVPHLEEVPELLWQAVAIAHSLVSQLKSPMPLPQPLA